MKVSTFGYGGQRLSKNITVRTNQENQPTFRLTVSAQVETFVTIRPKRARLIGKAAEPIAVQVSILQSEEYPFRILGPLDGETKNVRFTVSKLDKPKKGYVVTVENLRKEEGRYYDQIRLRTDSSIQPQLKISIYGNITK